MKALKIIGIVLVSLIVFLFAGYKYMIYNTKKNSPEQKVEYIENSAEVSITYSAPSKKGREIFGGLVPYNEVWRTGANEATVFTTNVDLSFGNEVLAAGTYSFFTIPNPDSWTLIWNTQEVPWGINYDGTSTRNPDFDALSLEYRVDILNETEESLKMTILGTPPTFELRWDDISIRAPFKTN